MAFVRWRGHCAQLLATQYEQGRSRQVCLTNLQNGYYVPEWMKDDVRSRFPQIEVDWAAVDRALAEGPPGSPSPTREQQEYAQVEQVLRQWAAEVAFPSEADTLRAAAQVLTNLRARTGN